MAINLMQLELDLQTKGQAQAVNALQKVDTKGKQTAASFKGLTSNAALVPKSMGQVRESFLSVGLSAAGANSSIASLVGGFTQLTLGPLGVASLVVLGVGAIIGALRRQKEAADESNTATRNLLLGLEQFGGTSFSLAISNLQRQRNEQREQLDQQIEDLEQFFEDVSTRREFATTEELNDKRQLLVRLKGLQERFNADTIRAINNLSAEEQKKQSDKNRKELAAEREHQEALQALRDFDPDAVTAGAGQILEDSTRVGNVALALRTLRSSVTSEVIEFSDDLFDAYDTLKQESERLFEELSDPSLTSEQKVALFSQLDAVQGPIDQFINTIKQDLGTDTFGRFWDFLGDETLLQQDGESFDDWIDRRVQFLKQKFPELAIAIHDEGEGIRKAWEDALDLKEAETRLAVDLNSLFADTLADAAFEGMDKGFKGIATAATAGIGRVLTEQGKALVLASAPLQAVAAALSNPFTAGAGALKYGLILIGLGAAFTKAAQGLAGGSEVTGTGPGGIGAPQIGGARQDELVRTRVPLGGQQAQSSLNAVGAQGPTQHITVIGYEDPRAQELIALGVKAATRRGL